MYCEISPYKVFEYYLVHPCCSSLELSPSLPPSLSVTLFPSSCSITVFLSSYHITLFLSRSSSSFSSLSLLLFPLD